MLVGDWVRQTTPEPPTTNAAPEEIQAQHQSFRQLALMLRDSKVWPIPDVYAPKMSLVAVPVYGGDIHVYVSHVNVVLTGLMLDNLIDHQALVEERREIFLRDHFFVNGRFADPDEGIRRLRDVTIKLADGHELRRLHPDLGLNAYQNLITSQQILRDLERFFVEVFRGNRTLTVSGARAHS